MNRSRKKRELIYAQVVVGIALAGVAFVAGFFSIIWGVV